MADLIKKLTIPNVTFDTQLTTAGGNATHSLSVGDVVLAFATVGGSGMWFCTAMYRNTGDPVSIDIEPNNTGYCSFRVSGDTLVCDTTYIARVVFVTFKA